MAHAWEISAHKLVGQGIGSYVMVRLPPASILKTVQYLTAHTWHPFNSHVFQAECQELLSALSSIAEKLTSMTRDEEAKDFLALLSQLGEQVSIHGAMQVELCGLGQEKTVVKIQGKIYMIDIRRLTKVSRPIQYTVSYYKPGFATVD